MKMCDRRCENKPKFTACQTFKRGKIHTHNMQSKWYEV